MRQLTEIDGYPCLAPSVAIHTVGAGGGSIAWRDQGGSLRVGPQSAGAFPGPAGYGRGGTGATVTDANIALGRIAPDAVFGDGVEIDQEAAVASIASLGARIGLDVTATALGILDVVEAHMERAIHEVSVREGHDLRLASLVAFGGAGGLHATSLAARLGMRSVVIPNHAGVFSAVGLLLSPIRTDVTIPSADLDPGSASGLRSKAVDTAHETFAATVGGAPDVIDVAAELRYVGQAHETRVGFPDGMTPDGLAEAFHAEHEVRNGFSRLGDLLELVSIRATGVGRPRITANISPEADGDARVAYREVETHGGRVTVEVRQRSGLIRGDTYQGPLIVEDAGATIWIPPGHTVLVHDDGELEVAI